jgi:chemotaxis protein CheD
MQEINVKMGEMQLTTRPGVVLVAPSLGSCIGFGVYDKKSRMAAMAHIVLPDSAVSSSSAATQLGKYADIAVPTILEKMLSLGSKKENLIIKIAGGAQMFNLNTGSNILNIGQRNTVAVQQAVANLGLTIAKADTGGNQGRTFKLNAVNGLFTLRIIGQEEVEF